MFIFFTRLFYISNKTLMIQTNLKTNLYLCKFYFYKNKKLHLAQLILHNKLLAINEFSTT